MVEDQIERNAEAYVDDVVVKTKEPDGLIEDLQETFTNLKKLSWKLNPNKCVFGIPAGQLLSWSVTEELKQAQCKLKPSWT